MGLFFTFNQVDHRSAIREHSQSIENAAKHTASAIDRLGVATEATGRRETVRYEETLCFDQAGNEVRCAKDLFNVLEVAKKTEPRKHEYLLMLQRTYFGLSQDFDLTDAMAKAGLIYKQEVHHFWNVVVGLESRRHAYRCLPDGMAREIHRNPENWR